MTRARDFSQSLGNVSDYIFYYSKSKEYTFNLIHTPHDEVYLANSFSNEIPNNSIIKLSGNIILDSKILRKELNISSSSI